MEKKLTSLETFNKLLKEEAGFAVYFSNDTCNVCTQVKPALQKMLEEAFPLLPVYYSDIGKYPIPAAQLAVFTVPTLLVFFQGKECIRQSRFINIPNVHQQIERFYEFTFL